MAQTLETIIAINARMGNGFSEVGATLMELGSMVNGVSQELINFGKASVETYRNYEMSMKDAEVALSTIYGRGSNELNAVMSQLDASATEWAATTIFHTDDVANAISEAAHANWDLDQILTGIPAAMQLAQAGSIDLSEAVNYIVKATNAAGIEFEDTSSFIDHWAFAANSSATTIDEMGEAMLKMGNTMKFAGGSDELLVMLAELANAGTVGTTAGTLLRNSMLRLVAPTQNAKEAMAELGATSEEASSIMSDEAVAAANAALQAAGFSAYDENGNLKNMLDVYGDLYLALGEIAGGYENISSNEESLDIISAIFPTRSITGALAMLEAAGEGYHGLYEALQGGDAENYGEYAAETMMDSLNGSMETFESKVERLKQLVGEELSGQIEAVLDSAGGLVDFFAELDDTTFTIIVQQMEILAGLGPALLIAGIGARAVGSAIQLLSNPVGQGIVTVALLAAAAIAISTAANALEEANFEENFGNLHLDTTEIEGYVSTIRAEFGAAQEVISAYQSELDAAVGSYETASSQLKGDLLTNLISDTELSSEQIASMESLGETMISSIQSGIENHYGLLQESIGNAFTGEGADGESDNPVLTQIMDVISQGYETDIAQAEALSQQLRDAMTSAFIDGHLNSEEIAAIQSIMDEQNALIAQQQDREHYLERERILRKAQSLGLESIEESSQIAQEERDAELETLLDQQAAARYDTAAWYDQAIANGWLIANTDGTAGEHVATEADKAAALNQLAAAQTNERYSFGAEFSEFLMSIWEQGIQDSDLAGAWTELSSLAAQYREAGGVLTQEAAGAWNTSINSQDAEQTSKYLNMMVEALGGASELQNYINYFGANGNAEMAGRYQTVLDMYNVLGAGGTAIAGSGGLGDYSGSIGSYDQMAALLSGYGLSLTPEDLAGYIQNAAQTGSNMNLPTYLGSAYTDMVNSAISAGFEGSGDEAIAAWVESVNATRPEINVKPVMDNTSTVENLDQVPIQATVGDDMQELQATIDGLDGERILTYIDADATDLEMSISSQDGKILVEHVTGNVASLAAAIAQFENRTITVNITGRQMFASGGRATTASIFGEAGPEWAIPEEHSERTASLLNAARKASGFTWPDLIARYGGLNASTESTPSTLVYSPTIYAADATGVEQTLSADKDRLERWYQEKMMRDAMEVYA